MKSCAVYFAGHISARKLFRVWDSCARCTRNASPKGAQSPGSLESLRSLPPCTLMQLSFPLGAPEVPHCKFDNLVGILSFAVNTSPGLNAVLLRAGAY